MMESFDEVKVLSKFEIEICFPPGPGGFQLEPVIRVGNRAVGARVTALSPSTNQDFFVIGRTSSPYPPPSVTDKGYLASKYLSIGSVMQSIDEECVLTKSFDCIMTLLHQKSDAHRWIRFKDVESSWLNMHRVATDLQSQETLQESKEILASSLEMGSINHSEAQPKIEPMEEDDVTNELDLNEQNLHSPLSLIAPAFTHSSLKTALMRTSPPPTASKQSPEVVLLDEFLLSPADSKSPFEEAAASFSQNNGLSPQTAPKALFTEQVSMQSIDLGSCRLEESILEDEAQDRRHALCSPLACPSPLNSSICSSSSLSTPSCACCGGGKMAALEEMVDALLTEKLNYVEEAERKEILFAQKLQQHTEREDELEKIIANQSNSYEEIIQGAIQDEETIESLEFQLKTSETNHRLLQQATVTHQRDIAALEATINDQSSALDRAYAMAADRELDTTSLSDEVSSLKRELSAYKGKCERFEAKIAASERTMRRDVEELSRSPPHSSQDMKECQRKLADAQDENAQLRSKMETLMFAALSRAQVVDAQHHGLQEDEEYDATMDVFQHGDTSMDNAAAQPPTPPKTTSPSKVVASPIFSINSYLETMVEEGLEEEDGALDVAGVSNSIQTPVKLSSPVELWQPPRTPNEKMNALQDMVDALLQEKLRFMEAASDSVEEIKALNDTIEALVSDARADEKALETALSNLETSQVEREELKDTLVDLESAYLTKISVLKHDLSQQTEASQATMRSLREEYEAKISNLESELTEVRCAMLEITQDDCSDESCSEEEQKEESQEDQVVEEMHSYDCAPLFAIIDGIDRDEVTSRSPAGQLAVADAIDYLGKSLNQDNLPGASSRIDPSTPSGKQKLSALLRWRKERDCSLSFTPQKSTPMTNCGHTTSSSRFLATPRTNNGNMTPVDKQVVNSKKEQVPRDLTTPRRQPPSSASKVLSAVRFNKHHTWSVGARAPNTSEKHWRLEANGAMKRLNETKAQLTIESELRVNLSHDLCETTKKLVESNHLRSQREAELSQVNHALSELQHQVKAMELERENLDIDHAYSLNMSKTSGFDASCEDVQNDCISVSSLTDVSIDHGVLPLNTSSDRIKLQLQVGFLKNEVRRARKSVERHRQKAANAHVEAEVRSTMRAIFQEMSCEERERAQRIDERALMAAEAASMSAAAAERAANTVAALTSERSMALARKDEATLEVEACRQECLELKLQQEDSAVQLRSVETNNHELVSKLGSLQEEAEVTNSKLTETRSKLTKALSVIEEAKHAESMRQKKKASELAAKRKKWLSDIADAKAGVAKEVDTAKTLNNIDEERCRNEKKIEDIESKLNKPHLIAHSKRWEESLRLQAEHHEANMKMLAAYKEQALALSKAQQEVDELKKQMAITNNKTEVQALQEQLDAALKAKLVAEHKLEEAAERYFQKDKETENAMQAERDAFEVRLQEAQQREIEANKKAQEADTQARLAQEQATRTQLQLDQAAISLVKELDDRKEEALNHAAAAADDRVSLLDHSSRLEEAVSALASQLKEAQVAVSEAQQDAVKSKTDSEAALTELHVQLLEVNQAKAESEAQVEESESTRVQLAQRINELENEISQMAAEQHQLIQTEGDVQLAEKITALQSELDATIQASVEASELVKEEVAQRTMLQNQLNGLEIKISYLTTELLISNEAVEQEVSMRQGAESKTEAMRLEVVKTTRFVDDLATQLLESAEANKMAHEALVSAEQDAISSRVASEQMKEHLTRSEQVEMKLSSMVGVANEKVAYLQAELEDLLATHSQSEDAVRMEADKDCAVLSTKIASAQNELTSLRGELEIALRSRTVCESQLANSQKALDEAQQALTSRTKVSAEYAASTIKERACLIERNEELANRIEVLCVELDHVRREHEVQLRELSQKHDLKLDQAFENIERFRLEITAKESVLNEASLRAQTAEADRNKFETLLVEERACFKGRLSETENELEQTKFQLKNMSQQSKDSQRTLELRITELENIAMDLRVKLTEAQESIEAAIIDAFEKAEIAASEMAIDVDKAHQAEIEQLHEELNLKKQSLSESEAQVEESESTRVQLAQRINELENEISQMVTKLALNELEVREEAEEKITALQSELDATIQASVEASELVKEEVAQRAMLQNQVNGLEANITSLQGELTEARAAEKDAKATSRALHKNVSILTDVLRQAEEKEPELIAELEDYEDQIDALSLRAAEAEQEAEDLKSKFDKSLSDRLDAEGQLQVLGLEVEQLKSNLAETLKTDAHREAQTLLLRKKLALELNFVVAQSAAEAAQCNALAKVSEIRSHKAEVDQAHLSLAVQQTESVAGHEIRRLESKVAISQRQLRARDDKIKDLQQSLLNATKDSETAQVEMRKVVEHSTARVAALEKQLNETKHQLELGVASNTPVARREPIALKISDPVPKKETDPASRPDQHQHPFADRVKLENMDIRLQDRLNRSKVLLGKINNNRQRAKPLSSSTAVSSAMKAPPVVEPKQLSLNTPIKATEVVVDKENLREVENAALVSVGKETARKTPSKLRKRLSLLSPTASSSSKKITPRGLKNSRRTRTPLAQSATAI